MARSVAGRLGGDGLVALGLLTGNVLGYALALVAARTLGPADFGELSALLVMVVVLAVVPTGLQTVVARAVAERRSHALTSASRLDVVRLSGTLAVAALGPAVLVGAVAGASSAACIGVAVTVAPLVALGWAQGLAQGAERPRLLGGLLVLNNGGRAAGALVGVVIFRDPVGAVLGGAAAGVLAATVGLALTAPPAPVSGRPRRSGWPREVAIASVALLSLYLCTGADVVLARVVLSPEDAGLYAAGAVLAKVSFWLPQFVAVTALPRLVDPARRAVALRSSSALVLGSAAVIVTVTAAAPGPLASVIGGDDYAAVAPRLPWFAVLGGLWALGQVLLYDALARRARLAALGLWLALGVLVVVVILLPSPSVGSLLATAVSAALGAIVVYLVRLPRSNQLTVGSGQGPGR